MADKNPLEILDKAALAALSPEERAAYRDAAAVEIAELNSIPDDQEVDVERLESLLSTVDEADGITKEVDEAAQVLADKRAALRERATALSTPAEDPEPEVEEVEETEEVEEDAPADKEPVLASGQKKSTVAASSSVAKKGPAVIVKKAEPQVSITAAANVPQFNQGHTFKDGEELAEAFLQRVGSFGGSNPSDMKSGIYHMSKQAQKFGVANIKRKEREFSVDREMSLEQQMSVILDASKESQFSQGLIAAGGWCAPSETIYALGGYETAAGLIDVPEVTARRGGISFTKGPDFMAIYGDADAGFIQTEAQAEAGTVKPCYALECPPFTEVRLDAVGYCATAPLLTEAAYPELVRRVLDLLALGHQRRKSASTIARIRNSMAAAVTFAPVSLAGSQSGVADFLGAAELRANQIRQSLAMDPNATIEGIAPWWVRGALRTDLSRRLGLADPFRITDADVDAYFTARNLRFQYVYDYQDLSTGNAGTAGGTATWTAWPTTVEFMLYPAGAYTRLVNDVISLQAAYDHDLLTGNEYTAAFVEEGMAVANTRGFGLRTTVALNPEGSAGFPAIGAGSGITFAAA